jgi:hypothetical protein
MPIKPHCWYETIKPIVEPHDWGTGDLFPTFGMPSLITICYSRIWHHQFWLATIRSKCFYQKEIRTSHQQ